MCWPRRSTQPPRRGSAAAAADERPRRAADPAFVRELAAGAGAVIVCARFEGVDERVVARRSLREVSIGDFVLSGGEPAAMALLDAVVRLLPGVMGDAASGAEESFDDGLLEYPQYTRPRIFEGEEIPAGAAVGRSPGDRAVEAQEAERTTRERRPICGQPMKARKQRQMMARRS